MGTPSAVAATKFCRMPELFVMPTPLIVRKMSGLVNLKSEFVIVNALAPGLNTMPLTSVLLGPDTKTPVVLEDANVAVSDGPLGMVAGVQLVAVFQSPSPGLRFQVALPANAVPTGKSRSGSKTAA